MDHVQLIARMRNTPAALKVLLAPISAADAKWKPAGGAWSILEIVNHLADEDRDDFRARLQSVMRDAAAPWPKTDPESWAIDRRYNERELGESLERFAHERELSLRWLAELDAPDWSTAYMHPTRGPVYAGELLVSWPAHDALHIRQIAKRLFELAARDGGKFGTDYAGEWKA